MPKCIQSDQGTNFISKVFAMVMKQLNIKHQVSSAYYPQSQGAIERFHQTLKSMFCTFCVEHEKECCLKKKLLLFAVRNTTQTSLGFSPSELVFVHGPFKILQEQTLKSQRVITERGGCSRSAVSKHIKCKVDWKKEIW